ncbi:MAG: hypothetical protein HY544_00445, partial [Candidatus Diapherotrites archaeon]|nr:hypothetical protein [Candidatus Diapherotrites archaeon]
VLRDEIKNNNTRIIFGERGVGKSALMIAINGNLQETSENGYVLITVIDEYSYLISQGNNLNKKWRIFLIRNLLKTFIQTTLLKNLSISRLDKIEKEKLSFIILNFYQTISKTEFYKFQTNSNYYNNFVNPALNTFLSASVALSSDFISKSLGLSKLENVDFYKEYIPKADTLKQIEINSLEISQLWQIFNDLIGICQKMEFKTIIFFLDKLDEDPAIGGNVKEEGKILLPILLNTSVLLDNKFSLVFLLWSKVKDELNRNHVRLDKIKATDVGWTQREVREIIEKRVSYFSNKTLTFDKLFQNVNDIDKILYLSNGSPRDALRLLSCIYDEEETSINSQGIFSPTSVTKGINKFLSGYDFYAIYPARSGSRRDILSIITKLKKIGKPNFKSKDIQTTFKFSQASAVNYVKLWKAFGVIKEDQEVVGKEKQYSLTDPKIEYLVRYQI